LTASSCDGPSKRGDVKNRKSGGEEKVYRHTDEPIPGLFLFEDFITEEQELQILSELDGKSPPHEDEFLPWQHSNFNGTHLGKRWGVHCNLRDRSVSAPENPLPHFIVGILAPKLKRLHSMKGCSPNEANAIDYRKMSGHHLLAHVDDRKLSKEPIANISLAGDCYMTFRNVAPSRNTAVSVQRVLLKRRCLQILTGKARYDFSHAIENNNLLSDRRVSITMRESPLTEKAARCDAPPPLQSWWKGTTVTLSSPVKPGITPAAEIIPGLFLYHDFITEEEEKLIMKELDCELKLKWNYERHTGMHREKRFGVDHDIWNRDVRAPRNPLPSFMHTILIPKLKRIASMHGCVPNDANAIDYRRADGDSLKAHVDDRKKHKEPIANISLCGDCFMTFRNQAAHRNLAVAEKKVLLKRRCLQVITGAARYDFSHAIDNNDLLSDRRVSLTMRETPIAL
jgi:alkylated DNA repair dioxygenase AlkB